MDLFLLKANRKSGPLQIIFKCLQISNTIYNLNKFTGTAGKSEGNRPETRKVMKNVEERKAKHSKWKINQSYTQSWPAVVGGWVAPKTAVE